MYNRTLFHDPFADAILVTKWVEETWEEAVLASGLATVQQSEDSRKLVRTLEAILMILLTSDSLLHTIPESDPISYPI
jgi:hypothetical protein